jgi:hypothetical protein
MRGDMFPMFERRPAQGKMQGKSSVYVMAWGVVSVSNHSLQKIVPFETAETIALGTAGVLLSFQYLAAFAEAPMWALHAQSRRASIIAHIQMESVSMASVTAKNDTAPTIIRLSSQDRARERVIAEQKNQGKKGGMRRKIGGAIIAFLELGKGRIVHLSSSLQVPMSQHRYRPLLLSAS